MVVKPHDPRQPRVTPEHVKQMLQDILGEQPEDLPAEARQLGRAHDVLYEALQEG
ncbi:hypothetical protein [Corynebacterium halotolerans]|uniref:hypothetical protein n=1 Tax=Corynebacterium halotolerans TaxID=225326 RepID=UPI003CECE493